MNAQQYIDKPATEPLPSVTRILSVLSGFVMGCLVLIYIGATH